MFSKQNKSNKPHSRENITRYNKTGKDLRLGNIEGKRRVWPRMKWLDSITDSMDMKLSTLSESVKDRGAWCVAAHGIAKSWT